MAASIVVGGKSMMYPTTTTSDLRSGQGVRESRISGSSFRPSGCFWGLINCSFTWDDHSGKTTTTMICPIKWENLPTGIWGAGILINPNMCYVNFTSPISPDPSGHMRPKLIPIGHWRVLLIHAGFGPHKPCPPWDSNHRYKSGAQKKTVSLK